MHRTCPLLGVKRTCRFALHMSAFDPKRTSIGDQLRMSEPPIGRGLPQNRRRLRSGSELPNANLVTAITVRTRKRPYYSKLKKEAAMRQTVLTAVVATLLITSAPHTAKAFFPIIGVAVGAGMVGGAMQDDSNRRQQSQQSQQSHQSEQYERSESATESKHTKRTTRAKHQNRNRDDSKIAKESPPKAKSHEFVANAPQAKPLTAGAPPTPDKFGE